MKKRDNNFGFTLLEVLIAVFNLALMSMMIWQITNNAYRGTEKAKSYDTIYQQARISFKRLTDDLSGAFMVLPSMQGVASDGTPALETGFFGEDSGERDRVDFDTMSGIRMVKNEKKSDVLEVGYYVDACPESETNEQCLMRRESAKVDRDVKTGGDGFAIARGVKSFQLEYYDPTKQEWRPDWSSQDPVFVGKLPRAVRMTLVFFDPKDEAGEVVFMTSVLLPMSVAPIDF